MRTRRDFNRLSRRRGFTLVELLVAMGLTLFVMAILAEAFASAMGTFAGLRSLGEMQDNLRTALQTLRADLSASHLEGNRRLSDMDIWATPPREGFFAFNGSAPTLEAVDPNLVSVRTQRAINHYLHFSVRQRGNLRQSFFVTGQAAGFSANQRLTPLYNTDYDSSYMTDASMGVASEWGEVAYFLAPMNASPAENTGLPLFKLYRTALVTLPFADTIVTTGSGATTTAVTLPAAVQERVSYGSSGGNVKLLTPNDFARGTGLTYRSYDWTNWLAAGAATGGPLGWPAATSNGPKSTRPNTLLCSNVVSFQIRYMTVNTVNGSNSIIWNDLNGTAFDSAGASPSGTGVGSQIVAMQFILRIYDPASGLSRQATLIQDM